MNYGILKQIKSRRVILTKKWLKDNLGIEQEDMVFFTKNEDGSVTLKKCTKENLLEILKDEKNA